LLVELCFSLATKNSSKISDLIITFTLIIKKLITIKPIKTL
jgi:hypothetical protein